MGKRERRAIKGRGSKGLGGGRGGLSLGFKGRGFTSGLVSPRGKEMLLIKNMG